MTATDSGRYTDFDAHAFHESLNKGRSSGTLRVGASGFRFLIAGEEKVHFPLAGTQLKLGGASERMIFLSHASVPGWSIYTSDRSLLNHAGLHSVPEIAEQLKRMKGKRRFNWAVLAAVVAALCLLPLLVVLNFDAVAAGLARQVPGDWERKLGQSAYAQYRVQHDILEEDAAEQSLDMLTDVLEEQLPESVYDFQFHIVNDPTLNAFALPGGYIVIHSGLIMKADNADELLGVLAHEMAHVTEQHGLRSIITSAGILVVVQAMLGDASGLLAVVASATPVLLNLQYSRDFEREADEHAVALLEKANINPNGMVSFFEKMIAEEQAMLDKVDDPDTAEVMHTVSEFLSTHPATEERIEHIQQLASDNNAGYRDMSDTFSQLQDIVKVFVAKASPDESNSPYKKE